MLKRLAAVLLTVFSFAQVGAPSRTPRTAPPGSATQGTLNVIFHGMFAFVVKPDHIEVLAPKVDYHVYKAGQWGHERRLKENVVYKLDGVEGSAVAPALDPRSHLIAQSNSIDRSPSALFCSLILPLPSSITGLRSIETNSQHVFVKGAALVPAGDHRRIPLVEVFSYPVADFSKLSLGPGIEWTASTSGSTVNLHVWAEPDAEPLSSDMDHPEHAFKQLIKLFPGMQIELTPAASSVMSSVDTAPAVRGVSTWEEMTLLERSKLMFGAPDPAQVASTGRGAQITNCVALFVTQ